MINIGLFFVILVVGFLSGIAISFFGYKIEYSIGKMHPVIGALVLALYLLFCLAGLVLVIWQITKLFIGGYC